MALLIALTLLSIVSAIACRMQLHGVVPLQPIQDFFVAFIVTSCILLALRCLGTLQGWDSRAVLIAQQQVFRLVIAGNFAILAWRLWHAQRQARMSKAE